MDKLIKEAQQLFGLQLNAHQIHALAIYERELLEWNEKFNLTAIREAGGIRTKHFLDSMSCVLAWKDNPPRTLIDIGTGAGFPGLVLKILYPALRVTLVESVGKKITFCKHMVETLALDNVESIQARAEDLGQDSQQREQYDVAVARAVANLPILAEYLLPLVRLGGAALAQKGESGPAEAQSAEKALKILGGKLRHLIPVTLPGVADERCLVVIDKVAATPRHYPRKPGTPTKQPL